MESRPDVGVVEVRVQVVEVLESHIGFAFGIELRLLLVGRRMRQMGCAGRIAPTDRALEKMPLQNVASGERVGAKDTHVWAVAGVYSRSAGAGGKGKEEKETKERIYSRLKRCLFKCLA